MTPDPLTPSPDSLSENERHMRQINSFAGNWIEDFPAENGNYLNFCPDCQRYFLGHKRRVTCKLCAQSSTPSPDSPTLRIYTKCPACGNDTLTVNDDKHLLCTWVSCPDPTLIDRVREENATLVEEMKGWRQTILDEVAALVKEREELRNELAYSKDLINTQSDGVHNSHTTIRDLRATLAERDREIERLKEDKDSLYRVADGRRMMIEVDAAAFREQAVERDSLRAQLLATQEKLKEAEKELEATSNLNVQYSADFCEAVERNLALQAHVEKLIAALKLIHTYCDDSTTPDEPGAAEKYNKALDNIIMTVDDVKDSQHDLTLIEEVREVLTRCQCTDEYCPTVTNRTMRGTWCHRCLLLTRLNPRQ